MGPQVESPRLGVWDTGKDPIEHGLCPAVDGVGTHQVRLGQELPGKREGRHRAPGAGIDGDQARGEIGFTDWDPGLPQFGNQIGIISLRAEDQVHVALGTHRGSRPGF
jgi:hypothetical protein